MIDIYELLKLDTLWLHVGRWFSTHGSARGNLTRLDTIYPLDIDILPRSGICAELLPRKIQIKRRNNSFLLLASLIYILELQV